MSQLDFFGEPIETKTVSAPEKPKVDSWYKGRVLSHSSIALYQTCPQKWKFRYIEKIPQQPRPYFSFGKSVHAGLEFLFTHLEGQLPTLEQVLAQYQQGWLREGYETAIQEKWFFQEGDRILRGFYAKHQKDFKNVFQIEYKFNLDIEGVPITGYIDRIDKTPKGQLAIIDYKTGKAFDKSRVRQDPQLTLYQIACKKSFGLDVESVSLYHLNSLTPLVVPAHSTTLENNYTKGLVEAARGINDNKFEPIVDAKGHCQWCDYAQVCPAFAGKKLPSTLQNADFNPVMETIDRLGKLDQKIKELTREKEELQQTVITQMTKSGLDTLKGHHYSVTKKTDDLPAVDITPLEVENP